MVLEKNIEAAFVTAVREQLGGVAYKLTSSGHRGLPDRLVLLPLRRVFFVELKAPGRKPTTLQQRRIADLNELGHECFLIDSYAEISRFVTYVKALPPPRAYY